jgi:hypothetical protein
MMLKIYNVPAKKWPGNERETSSNHTTVETHVSIEQFPSNAVHGHAQVVLIAKIANFNFIKTPMYIL